MIVNKKINGLINSQGGYFENEDLIFDKVEINELKSMQNWIKQIDSLI